MPQIHVRGGRPTAHRKAIVKRQLRKSRYAMIGAAAVLSLTFALPPAIAQIRANPAGCTTKADNPHPSRHEPGRINAEVRQQCPVVVERNSTEAKLWERRWWGYDVIGGPNFSELTTSKNSKVSVSAPCRTNSIRVTGYGHYLWAGQHFQSAEVSNTKDVAC